MIVNKRNSIQWVLAGILAIMIAVIVLAGIFFSGERKGKSLLTVLETVSGAADLEVRDFRYSQAGDPEFQWEVRADLARYYREKELLSLETVFVRMLSRKGREYFMTGRQGTLNSELGDMTLSGDVEIVSDEGERLTTDTLNYRASDRTVHTDDSVQMHRKNLDLSGKGMTFTIERNDLVLFSDVKAVITDVSLFR